MNTQLTNELTEFFDKHNVPGHARIYPDPGITDRKAVRGFILFDLPAAMRAFVSMTVLPGIQSTLNRVLESPRSSEVEPEDLQTDYDCEYQGDAHKRLHKHLLVCREQYRVCRDVFKFPYFAIVQSSGFGKSRVVKELATTVSREENEKGEERLHVVYCCLRKPGSTGFPPATTNLSEYLFPRGVEVQSTFGFGAGAPIASDKTKTDRRVSTLADRLIQVFTHVMFPVSWEEVKRTTCTGVRRRRCGVCSGPQEQSNCSILGAEAESDNDNGPRD